MTLSERIARGPAKCGRTDPHGPHTGYRLAPHSRESYCPGSVRPFGPMAQPVQSPFTRRALARELPAKDVTR